jgi:hypothetical protein
MLAASLTVMLAACATTQGPVPLARQLPAVDVVIPRPVPRPAARAGDDARLAALRAYGYGDANAARLQQAREAYEALAKDYAAKP